MNVWQRLKQLAGRAEPTPPISGGVIKRSATMSSANAKRGKSASAFLSERAGKRRDVYRLDPEVLKFPLLNRIERSRRAAQQPS